MANRPNVLFLLSDEHSFRAMSRLDPAGEGEPVSTPNFDRLAQTGLSFERTYCQVPLCTPSRICMLTGMNPIHSGGWTNNSPIADDRPTLASSFTDAGYETALIGKMHLGGPNQFVGFKHRPYGDLTGKPAHQWEPLHRQGGRRMADRTRDAGITEIPESAFQEQITADETLAFIREQTAGDAERPWMVCASFSRPHFPLTAPKRWWDRYWPDGVTHPKVARTGDTAEHPMTLGMAAGFKTQRIDEEEMLKARAGYFAAVSYLDEVIGDLLARLEMTGELDNTIIVYTSDHGELMGEHGMWWKNSWHEGAVHVPWLFQLPAHRRGELGPANLTTPVSLVDLYPTLCALAGIDWPDDLEGTDLSPAISAGQEPDRGPVFFTNPLPRWGEKTENVAVLAGRYKYVAFAESSWDLLFDLEADPLEQHNLLGQSKPAAGTEAGRIVDGKASELRQQIQSYWNFQAAAVAGQAAEEKKRQLPASPDCSNANLYVMPSGQVVDAETPLYAPAVVAESQDSLFAAVPNA